MSFDFDFDPFTRRGDAGASAYSGFDDDADSDYYRSAPIAEEVTGSTLGSGQWRRADIPAPPPPRPGLLSRIGSGISSAWNGLTGMFRRRPAPPAADAAGPTADPNGFVDVPLIEPQPQPEAPRRGFFSRLGGLFGRR